MSIIIPGVELPPIDEYLHLRIDGNGYVSAQISAVECVCFLADTDRKAIEIPPHGRLGDLDDLKERIKICVETAQDDCFDLGVIWYSTFAEMVALSPTIIPADPKKEDTP